MPRRRHSWTDLPSTSYFILCGQNTQGWYVVAIALEMPLLQCAFCVDSNNYIQRTIIDTAPEMWSSESLPPIWVCDSHLLLCFIISNFYFNYVFQRYFSNVSCRVSWFTRSGHWACHSVDQHVWCCRFMPFTGKTVCFCVCVFLISLLSELQKLVCFHGVVSCSSTFVSVGFLVHYLQICDKKNIASIPTLCWFFVTELSSLTCAKYENVNTLQNRKTLTRCRTSHLTRTQNIFYIAVLNVGVFLSGHTSKPQYALPGFPFFFFWPARGPES